jgi:4-amino-4-deoxy-L-arabinose transferase-like glycosyltransferase
MAQTLNGIGTTFYGERDFRADGTHLTTEWLVFLYIPLIPIRSLRARNEGPAKHRSYFMGSASSYTVYEKHFPHWKQVIYTYGYVALLAAWGYFLIRLAFWLDAKNFATGLGLTLVFLTWLIPVPTPWLLRHFAKKKLRFSSKHRASFIAGSDGDIKPVS